MKTVSASKNRLFRCLCASIIFGAMTLVGGVARVHAQTSPHSGSYYIGSVGDGGLAVQFTYDTYYNDHQYLSGAYKAALTPFPNNYQVWYINETGSGNEAYIEALGPFEGPGSLDALQATSDTYWNGNGYVNGVDNVAITTNTLAPYQLWDILPAPNNTWTLLNVGTGMAMQATYEEYFNDYQYLYNCRNVCMINWPYVANNPFAQWVIQSS